MLVSSIGHVKSGMKLGRPRSKAKEYSRSIVNKYCEGKVKSTSNRRVKENLKPYAYKRSEHLMV